MDRLDSRDFKTIDGISSILLRAQKFFYAIYCQETLEPLVFIIVTSDKSNIAIAGLVAALLDSLVICSKFAWLDFLPCQRQYNQAVPVKFLRRTQVAQDRSFHTTAAVWGTLS